MFFFQVDFSLSLEIKLNTDLKKMKKIAQSCRKTFNLKKKKIKNFF